MTTHQKYNEHTLLEGLRRGDRAANEQIYKDIIAQLCYFIESITGDTQAAEDIAAESLVKGFSRIREFEKVDNFKYFVFKVAKNAAIDHTLATKRHQKAHEEITYLSGETAEATDRHYIESEALRLIYREITQLPLQVRTVIELSIIKGLSISEIAAEMKLAYKTVQHHKTKGIQLLRVAMIRNKLLSIPLLALVLQLLLHFSEKK